MKFEEFAPVVLQNGIVIRFVDQSNRYFGDFHRICITAEVSLPENFVLPVGFPKEQARLKKRLEKMAVTSDAIESERRALVEAFLATSRAYFEKDDFPRQLLRKLQQEKPKPIFLRNP